MFDVVGKLSAARGKGALSRGGVFVSVKGSAKLESGDLDRLRVLAEADELKAVIDRRYALEDIAQAHEYVERGHKRGNVVITMP